MSDLREFSQAAADRLDYGFLFSRWLIDGDTIASSVWSVPSPLVSSSPTVNSAPIVRCGVMHPANTATSVFITGGVLGARYLVTNTITTTHGRTFARRFRLVITEPESL